MICRSHGSLKWSARLKKDTNSAESLESLRCARTNSSVVSPSTLLSSSHRASLFSSRALSRSILSILEAILSRQINRGAIISLNDSITSSSVLLRFLLREVEADSPSCLDPGLDVRDAFQPTAKQLGLHHLLKFRQIARLEIGTLHPPLFYFQCNKTTHECGVFLGRPVVFCTSVICVPVARSFCIHASVYPESIQESSLKLVHASLVSIVLIGGLASAGSGPNFHPRRPGVREHSHGV
ncbi:uncharacterized protein G2W53_039134 [Senna tora]|uniref:Uncharacterized protein n=1 Tax=Senna tora TaxID=362788 RepID=A0A834W362_9FABA|nr:uncharacterized protein G2W53_039134 [Senna tora]